MYVVVVQGVSRVFYVGLNARCIVLLCVCDVVFVFWFVCCCVCFCLDVLRLLYFV